MTAMNSADFSQMVVGHRNIIMDMTLSTSMMDVFFLCRTYHSSISFFKYITNILGCV